MLDLLRLKPQELRALPREKTWFFVPVGGVEDHGPHLPLGMDVLEADAAIEAVYARLRANDPEIVGVRLPPIPLSIDPVVPHLAIRFRAHVVRDYLVDLVDSLYREGFRFVAVYSGSFGPLQLTAIEEAGKFLRRKHRRFPGRSKKPAPLLVSLSSVDLDPEVESRALFWLEPPEHGGKRDTAVARSFFPNEVGPVPPSVGNPPDWTLAARLSLGARREFPSYWGDAECADPDTARRRLDDKVGTWTPKLLAAMRGSPPRYLFTSKFSWLPTNHSLFRIYVLGTILLMVFLGWVMLAMRSMVGEF